MAFTLILLDIFSIFLLAVILFWTVYNGSIIFIGVRGKKKRKYSDKPYTETQRQLPKFSIIVPTKDEALVIGRCMGGILDIDYPKDKLELIIIDGNSKDSTREICSKFLDRKAENIKIINEGASKGKPAALNTALSYATGEIVGVFDADSMPEKGILRKVASYFNNQKVMAIQGKTTSINEKNNILTRVISMEEKAWFQALLTGKEKLNLFIPLTGSCQFVRRTVLEELGGWDETSLTEDVELAIRLVEKNHLTKYAPDICSGQETPNDIRGLFKQRVRWYRGYMETAIKYGRLLDKLSKKTIDAEISLIGPFLMVISLISYINWAMLALFFSTSNPILNFTGLVIALTAASLISIGIALTAAEKPIKLRNVLWIPSIYAYWLLQMSIASWAFLKLLTRRKRVWNKTIKKGLTSSEINKIKAL
jgi:cellulose synthase/poly-beta-1,6-N-acetylglucosamine synthase-like glycosyltransferase